MQDFKKLKVWEKAHQFTLAVYRQTRSFPPRELFKVTRQLTEAAASIASNIAEGSSRASRADFRRYLEISLGSANESDYFLILSRDLGYLSPADYAKLDGGVVEVRKILVALMARLRSPGP